VKQNLSPIQTFVALVVFMVLFPGLLMAGPIYVFKDRSGAVRFTTKPPPEGAKAEVFTSKGVSFSILGPRRAKQIGNKLFTSQYTEVIHSAARANGLSEELVRAVIHAESAFNPSAVSPKGARGLMQLMPALAREFGVRNSFDPYENIQAGCRFLAMLLRKYSGDLRLSLAAYNAGPGAVDKYKGIPPYAETRDYVEKVLALRTRYAVARKKITVKSNERPGSKNP
jgi:soluble lytic murein transglycosylase-like protein